MANYSFVLFLVLMLSINVGLGLYDVSLKSYNGDFKSFINYSSTPAGIMGINGSLDTDINVDESFANPDSSDSVDTDTGNIFTDTWKSVSNWFNNVNDRFSYITGIVNQPMGFLKDIGVPNIYANAFGIIWYVIAIFLLVGALKGGSFD